MAANPTQRRLTTILAADVAGYSRLTGADEEGTLARIRALRSELIDPAISANRGRVVNTAGDSILAEFASVVDAMRAAIDIQRAMTILNADFVLEKRIEFRIGVHVGDVMVESDGDLMGDGVNIAARLEGVCEPGGVSLSEDAYRQVRDKLKEQFVDVGDKELKNIARPVRVYSLQVGVPTQPKPATPADPATRAKPVAPKKRLPWASLAVGIAALLIVVAAGAWYFLANRTAPVATNAPAPAAAHLSIVVLPFANLSGGQDYLADGITENLTTELSRIYNSFVIARNTAFTYKDKNIDAKEIGRELGVRYVLEGSVQRDQNRVRVNAQLIDAESGAHLWADRFEEDVTDLFMLQDQVVVRLAYATGNELVKAEAKKSVHSRNPDAVDLAMRGWALFWQPMPTKGKDRNDAARALFEQSLKIDPNEADALAGDAMTYHEELVWGWTNSETDYAAKVLGQADRVIALAPDNMWAYYIKSGYLGGLHRENEALRAADAGLAINPNSALLHWTRGGVKNSMGRFDQAKPDFQLAIRLSPRDLLIMWFHEDLGVAEFGLGHFDAAIEEFLRSIDAGNHSYAPYVDLAAAYGFKGQMEEAKSALAEARRLEPKLTNIKWMVERWPNIPAYFEGLRKAGLPEE